MNPTFFPEQFFALGYPDLVSVIPPGAALAPSSKIPPAHIGKVPGRRGSSGLWTGYDWRRHVATPADVHQWCLDGASIGLRADQFPGIDIDCTNEQIAEIIQEAVVAKLGPAPVRFGRVPKRLLMYRTDQPFGRMRLWFHYAGEQHLVEVLGQGQQYLVHGQHPVTGKPYEWTGEITPAHQLRIVTRELADALLTELAQYLELLGAVNVEREGDGKAASAVVPKQEGLLAPSLDALREAVAKIPNTNDLFPSRNDYLTMGYAIRAAAGEEHADDAFGIFAEWAAKWEGNDRAAGNDPDTVMQDWHRMRGMKKVGWQWIAEHARTFGYNDAAEEFEATTSAPPDAKPLTAPLYSDQWISDRVVERRAGELRFVPQTGKYLVWDGARWRVDAELLAEDLINQELRVIADQVMRQGATEKEIAANQKLAVQICSAGKAAAVASIARTNRALAVSVDFLDHDVWLLNTPAGMIDLKTGELRPADPDALCTKSTAVPADFSADCPRWKSFLREATGGDETLVGYLRRLCGYALTGSTREQHLTFIYGDGGNGKGVFLGVLGGVLADYARSAPMDSFTAGGSERHPTDLAGLAGARLVTASETTAGKHWDETRIKSLTGGDPIAARFMRQDFFTYTPQFKLVFIGNNKPEIRSVDRAMRRRIQMVPFVVKPKVVDNELAQKLKAEWPAILAWMVEGCLEWQREGLAPPAIVQAKTAEYFDEEDTIGRWLNDRCDRVPEGRSTTTELFESWREWANQQGEYVMSMKRLSAQLTARGYARYRDGVTRRWGFEGLTVRDRQELEIA